MKSTLQPHTAFNQRGVSIIAVIAILLILSVMGIAVISMVTSLSTTSVNLSFSKQALYVAEGGLERGTAYLLRDVPGGACADMSTDITLSNVSLGSGLFSVTQDGNSPYYLSSAPSPATLSTAILSTDLAIPVDSVAGYSDSGRIMIDREWVDYVKKETTATPDCPSPPCLMANLRGADGSTAAGHALGTKVGQYQCTVVSTGGAPDLTTPSSGKRVVSQAVMLQEGWVVGAVGGGVTEDMNDIHCAAQNDCWAVGANGAIAHWDGASWSTVTSPTTQGLNGVFMVSATDGWAVGMQSGTRPAMLRWDNNCSGTVSGTGVWTDCTSTAPTINRDLNSVYMVSATDGWAVGNNGEIIQYSLGSWSAVTSPTGRRLNSVTCTPDTNCWAVGNNGEIIHWDGVIWTVAASPTGRQLNSVTCTSDTNCWAVGNRWGNNFTIVHWDGITPWTDQSFFDSSNRATLNAVHCADVNNCWAVGNLNGNNFTFVEWNGAAWLASPLTDATNRENLNGVYCTSSSDCWSVGIAGKFLRWDGASWSLYGGANASMLRWNGVAAPVSWSDVTASLLPAGVDEVNGVSMLSYADGWAVGNAVGGNATIIRWNGSAWSSVPPTPVVNQDLEAVFALSADDAWAVGMSGTIIGWDGTNWSTVASPTGQDLNAVSCTSSTDCRAVGMNGAIVHWDGISWTTAASPIGQELNALICISSTDCRAVGTNGTIVHWNGISWSSVASPTGQDLNAVSCTSSTDCRAVGMNGAIVHWDGISWTTAASPTGQDLRGVSLASPIDGWAVGMGGTVLQWDGVIWSIAASPTTADLNGLSLIAPRDRPQTVWREEFD
jgi:hypothetical protein